jgi:hypothetical protein
VIVKRSSDLNNDPISQALRKSKLYARGWSERESLDCFDNFRSLKPAELDAAIRVGRLGHSLSTKGHTRRQGPTNFKFAMMHVSQWSSCGDAEIRHCIFPRNIVERRNGSTCWEPINGAWNAAALPNLLS